jgi:phosphoribosylaminoimidazole-succinocarboxamide synthase
MGKRRVYYKGGQSLCQERISCGSGSCCQPSVSPVRSARFARRVTSLKGLLLPASPLILQTSLDGLTRHNQGKVRDIYSFPDDPSVLLIVATDRISAFDYVLGSGIPDKGKVLTQLSAFWFGVTNDIVANHMRSTRVEDYPPAAQGHAEALQGRSTLVLRTEPFPVECVARGYLAGSGWKEYQDTGSVCGVKLPGGLRESDRLPEPIFTPATKATSGHDMNISEEEAGRIVGRQTIEKLRDLTLRVYSRGAAHAEHRGIIVADTKLEFGRILDGPNRDGIILIDEVLTPDSSRFWPRDLYAPGSSQPSFDKQYVRDYLDSIRWNRQPPVPTLPDDVIKKTSDKYLQAFQLLSGLELE